MKSSKQKRIKKSVILIFTLSIIAVTIFLLATTNISFWFKKSVHEDAKRYTTKHCLVFYPDSIEAKQYAKNIAKNEKQDRIFDYSLVPYGDYYLVNYSQNYQYYVDKNFKPIEVSELSDFGKQIISDYLRYQIKKEKPDKYYTLDFIDKSYVNNLDFSNVNYDIEKENLVCHFSDFDIDVLVPLKYIQTEINMNFGYPIESYVKPVYIDTSGKHPIICLTFDDGPQFWQDKEESSSVKIIDTLYKYDVSATFFVVGDMLEESDVWSDYEKYNFFKTSIEQGNEYGSHTKHHDYLPDLTASQIKQTILDPSEYLNDLVGYKMSLYRPPEGAIDESVLQAQPYPAIFWSDDSYDWSSLDAQGIYERMIGRNYYDGDIILFHEIYDSTAETIEKLIPYFVEKGFQLVTVSNMLASLGIDTSTLSYYYNFSPNPYYE